MSDQQVMDIPLNCSAARILAVQRPCPGLSLVEVEALGGPLRLSWRLPAIGVAGNWHPDRQFFRGVPMPFARDPICDSTAFLNAPLQCLHDADGTNVLCFAVDEILRPVRLSAAILEEPWAVEDCAVELPAAAAGDRLLLRLDRRSIPWTQAVAEVGTWWVPPGERLPTSPGAREPLWCTWYAFHKQLDDATVQREIDLAAALGFGLINIDDGWQMRHAQRDMESTGDWAPTGLADLPGLVQHIHQAGMRAALWFAPPFLGHQADCRAALAKHSIGSNANARCDILDPREPAVCDHVCQRLIERVRTSGVDGVFLDFLTSWGPWKPDQIDIILAGEALATRLSSELRALRADLHIQYRMPYHGPAAWRRCDVLRANDCPADALTNRLRVLDMRALCGERTIHGDMALWPAAAAPRQIARQLHAALFAVPQVSVHLAALTTDQAATLRFWITWWRRWRAVLLDGTLALHRSEHLFPLVEADRDGRRVSVLYDRQDLTEDPRGSAAWAIVNAGPTDAPVVELQQPGRWRSWDCQGRELGEQHCGAGFERLRLPSGGVAEWHKDGP